MKSRKEDSLTSRDLQAIERREQLLASAKELFASKGYHATTTREITRNIGMADGLIYHYFPEGKQQILNLILKDFLEERYVVVEREINSLNDELPMEDLLMSLGNIFFSYIAKDKNVLLILLKEQGTFSESYTDGFNQHVNQLIKLMMDRIQVYVDRKEIRSFDIFMMVNQFWSAIYAYIIQDVFFNDHKMYQSDQDTYLKQIVEHTLLTWKI